MYPVSSFTTALPSVEPARKIGQVADIKPTTAASGGAGHLGGRCHGGKGPLAAHAVMLAARLESRHAGLGHREIPLATPLDVSHESKTAKMGAGRVMRATQTLRDDHRAITYNRTDCSYLPTEALRTRSRRSHARPTTWEPRGNSTSRGCRVRSALIYMRHGVASSVEKTKGGHLAAHPQREDSIPCL